MDTDLRAIPSRARRGVAMFVVLGAILLVTLFGFVGITLADRDQTLSGDLNDIKSRDEAAYSGLQIAINRLTADPDSMVAMLNTFIRRSYALNGNPDSAWISLDSTNKLHLEQNKPDWFSLSNSIGDQTAARVRIVAVQHADTTSVVEFDSSKIFVTLQCFARGRHGDEKAIQAAFRVHGVTGDNKSQLLPYTVPRHSFYVGGSLVNNNLHLGAQGDVYVASGNGTYFNTGANQSIEGNLQYNDNISLNSHLRIKGNMVINGTLTMNAGGSLRVDSNLQINSGLGRINSDSTIFIGGNAYINGPDGPTEWTRPGNWNSSKGIRVGKSLFLFHSNYADGAQTPKSLVVGRDAWIVRSGQFTLGANDSFYVGRDLIYGDNLASHDGGYTVNGGVLYKVGRTLLGGLKTAVRIPGGIIGDTIQVIDSITVQSGKTLTVTGAVRANFVLGTISGPTLTSPGTINWRPVPTTDSFGIPLALSNTSLNSNPMDSVKVDAKHSPTVEASLITFPGKEVSGIRLNAIYDSLKSANKLLNGYMCLLVSSGQSLTAENSAAAFSGKMIMVVEGSISVNQKWPSSRSLSNIQVILVRRKGSLTQFGWNGAFAGILYWENPCNDNTIMTSGTMYGAMLLGSSLTSPDYGYASTDLCSPAKRAKFQTNTGDLSIVLDTAVFMDIGRNLPGVLAPARDAANNPITAQGTIAIWRYAPTLRLVHNKPFFEPIGVFR